MEPGQQTADAFFRPATTYRRASALRVIEELRGVWESFPLANPMQSYIWKHACAEVLADGEIRIVTAGGNRPRAIAILCRSQRSRSFRPLGEELYEPIEFAYNNANSAEELAEALFRLGVPITIRDMFAESVLVRFLRRTYRQRLVTQPTAGHPYIELDDTWSEPESHLNSRRRSDLRRAHRRAARLGPVHCQFIEPHHADIDRLLSEAYRVEAASWKGRTRSALAIDARVGAFYRAYAHAACMRGILRLGFLRIGERAVAMQLAVQESGGFWLLKMGFDEQFSRCSPGALLMVESLKYAWQRGCSHYELMGQREPWNQIWKPQVHPSLTVHLHAASPIGLLTAAVDRTRSIPLTWIRKRYRSR